MEMIKAGLSWLSNDLFVASTESLYRGGPGKTGVTLSQIQNIVYIYIYKENIMYDWCICLFIALYLIFKEKFPPKVTAFLCKYNYSKYVEIVYVCIYRNSFCKSIFFIYSCSYVRTAQLTSGISSQQYTR